MLIPQWTECETNGGQGRPACGLAELRRELAQPSTCRDADGLRQRLLELVQRLGRVQSLGDEYARVEVSEHVATRLTTPVVA